MAQLEPIVVCRVYQTRQSTRLRADAPVQMDIRTQHTEQHAVCRSGSDTVKQ